MFVFFVFVSKTSHVEHKRLVSKTFKNRYFLDFLNTVSFTLHKMSSRSYHREKQSFAKWHGGKKVGKKPTLCGL